MLQSLTTTGTKSTFLFTTVLRHLQEVCYKEWISIKKKKNDTTCFTLLKDQHFLRSISERQAVRCLDSCRSQYTGHSSLTRLRESYHWRKKQSVTAKPSGIVWVYSCYTCYTVRTHHLPPVTETDSKYEYRAKIIDDFSSFAPQLEVEWCLNGSVKTGNNLRVISKFCTYYHPQNARFSHHTKAIHNATSCWGIHIIDQLAKRHLNFPFLENAVCKCARDPSLISVCLCVTNFRLRALLRSSNSAFCQQKTLSYSQFSRILLSLLFSTLPDGFQTISFKGLIQSSKFIICTWSSTKER